MGKWLTFALTLFRSVENLYSTLWLFNWIKGTLILWSVWNCFKGDANFTYLLIVYIVWYLLSLRHCLLLCVEFNTFHLSCGKQPFWKFTYFNWLLISLLLFKLWCILSVFYHRAVFLGRTFGNRLFNFNLWLVSHHVFRTHQHVGDLCFSLHVVIHFLSHKVLVRSIAHLLVLAYGKPLDWLFRFLFGPLRASCACISRAKPSC